MIASRIVQVFLHKLKWSKLNFLYCCSLAEQKQLVYRKLKTMTTEFEVPDEISKQLEPFSPQGTRRVHIEQTTGSESDLEKIEKVLMDEIKENR